MTASIDELVAEYGAEDLGLAHALCDRHPVDPPAFTVVEDDLRTVTLTYGQLRESSEADWRRPSPSRQIGPGDRIATLMGKSVDYVTTVVAIWRLGAVHVPLFTAFAPPAIAFRLEASHTKAVVCDDGDSGESSTPAPTSGRIRLDGHRRRPRRRTTRGRPPPPGPPRRPGPRASPRPPSVEDAPMIHLFTSGTHRHAEGVVAARLRPAAIQGPTWSTASTCATTTSSGAGPTQAGPTASTTPSSAPSPSSLRPCSSTPPSPPPSPGAVLADHRVTNFAAAPDRLPLPARRFVRRRARAGDAPGVQRRRATHPGRQRMGHRRPRGHRARPLWPDRGRDAGQQPPPPRGRPAAEAPAAWVGPCRAGRSHVLEARPGRARGARRRRTHRRRHDRPSPLGLVPPHYEDACRRPPPRSSARTAAGTSTGDTAYVDEDGDIHFTPRGTTTSSSWPGYRIGPFEVESVLNGPPLRCWSRRPSPCPTRSGARCWRRTSCSTPGHPRQPRSGPPSSSSWSRRGWPPTPIPANVIFIDEMPKTPERQGPALRAPGTAPPASWRPDRRVQALVTSTVKGRWRVWGRGVRHRRSPSPWWRLGPRGR